MVEPGLIWALRLTTSALEHPGLALSWCRLGTGKGAVTIALYATVLPASPWTLRFSRC